MRHLPKLLVIALIAAGCANGQTEDPETLTLIAHESFAGSVDDTTFAAFTEETGIAVDVLASDDAGTLVNQAVLTKDNPLADVLFGIDDTFLSRAVDEEIFVSYRSSLLDSVDESLHPDTDLVTPISFGDVCFNYDKAWFEDAGVAVPDTLDAIAANASLVTVQHPATSSPGLAFLLATVGTYGESGWTDWWEEARANGINVANDWETAYYTDFTRYGGATPIVLSYASSPPAEVLFSDEPLSEAPTGVIEAGCYRQVEYAGVLTGTEFPEAAGQLIDFMLTVEFQEGIPLTWFVFPANGDAQLPPEFVEHTSIPTDPIRLEPDTIAQNRDRWIDEWITVMEG